MDVGQQARNGREMDKGTRQQTCQEKKRWTVSLKGILYRPLGQ